jgi:MFS family permease
MPLLSTRSTCLSLARQGPRTVSASEREVSPRDRSRRVAAAETKASKAKWLTPGVGGVGAASLLSDLGHEVPTALLPRFITSLGGSAAALGIIEGFADGLAGISRLVGGALADDPSRRRATAIGGYTSVAVLSGLIGAATALWQVALLRVGDGRPAGFEFPPRNALLADAAPPEAYGRAYGFERMMDNLGAIGGPLLALALVAAFSVRTAILLSIIPGLLATVAIIYAISRLPKLAAHERKPIRIKVHPVFDAGLGRLMFSISAFDRADAWERLGDEHRAPALCRLQHRGDPHECSRRACE